MPRRISCSLPAMSPTTLLTWASATRMTRKLALRALPQPAVDELLQVRILWRGRLVGGSVGLRDHAGGRRVATQHDRGARGAKLRAVGRAELLGEGLQRRAVGAIGVI